MIGVALLRLPQHAQRAPSPPSRPPPPGHGSSPVFPDPAPRGPLDGAAIRRSAPWRSCCSRPPRPPRSRSARSARSWRRCASTRRSSIKRRRSRRRARALRRRCCSWATMNAHRRRATRRGKVYPHSNEMLLVRIDPSRPTISMLSIPRELQVTFTTPSGKSITNRINSAYTYGSSEGGGTTGGVKLMVETIKHLFSVGGSFAINHVFVTNFPNFKRAVSEMGCVYMSVGQALLPRQRTRRRTVLRNQPPAGVPEALRPGSARIRRKPPRRHVAHARRARPALPALGQEPIRSLRARKP